MKIAELLLLKELSVHFHSKVGKLIMKVITDDGLVFRFKRI